MRVLSNINKILLTLYAFLLAGVAPASGITLRDLLEEQTPPRAWVFKTMGGADVRLFAFFPRDAKPGDRRTAVVWIHGGGWTSGNAQAFFPHARYYAERGAVGISIEYRLVKPGGTSIADSVADCKSAIRFIRSHTLDLGVHPDRIVVMGDSAGGHLAASLGTVPGFDDSADDRSVSSVPNAAVLYNPITDLTEAHWTKHAPGTLGRALSPIFQVRRGLPPMLVLHGIEDRTVSADQSRRFADAMQAAGNRCDLSLYEKARHAFVVVNYTAPEHTVVQAINEGDRFLTSLGLLSGSPSLESLSPLPEPRTATKWWTQRHEQIVSRVQQGKVDLVLIGDSITNNYDKERPPHENFKPTWDRFYGKRNAVNMGFSGDTTGNVLWRLENGEVDGIQPKAAVVLIGTNDTARGLSAERTAAGIEEIVHTLHVKLPSAKILLLGILPSRISDHKTQADKDVNERLARTYAAHSYVTYLDISQIFFENGKLRDELFYDPQLTPPRGPLHPDTTGQRMMAEAIEPSLASLMKDKLN